MALANNVFLHPRLRPYALSPEVEYDQSEQCTTSLENFEDFCPEKEEM
jgi:hypothetical protein